MSQTNTKTTILINMTPFHFEQTTLSPDDFRQAVDLQSEYEVWRIVHSPDPEGQLPIDDVQITGSVTIENGERYRVVPPGTFGLIDIPSGLATEIDSLRGEGHAIDISVQDGWINIVFGRYSIPATYNQPVTTLLLRFPVSYPNGKPDMFWTDVSLALANGKTPEKANVVENAIGRQWRRFSWHPKTWNPATCDLRTYLEFVNRRLAMAN